MARRIRINWLILMGLAVLVAGCAETQFLISGTKRLQGASAANGTYKIGNPYQIAGTWYYPAEEWDYDETGIASWYGDDFHGKNTANGESYDMNDLTAAHRTLPMPSFVRVVNLENGRSVVLRINDRGPFAKGRIIDVSRRAAQLLGFRDKGTARVRVQVMAERSQALKAQLLGHETIAQHGSPIQVDKLPKASVSAESLPPPPGARAAPQPQPVESAAAAPTSAPGRQVATAEEIRPGTMPEPEVTTVAVGPTSIFVQAGSFTNYQNALRTKLMVSRVSPATISHVLIDNRDFYRVRVGPLASVEDADRTLERVQALGYPGARIVVAGTGSGS
ncbi:MAG: septal ring lytic transglycosylase RlpA family protein [Rhodospirillales bacterium CG15_BIG_FIL_POST_REV_8_21_14_020_66_15]|nr:MAG: septal ring lytic transglycosylase RlpA family protein [Rhodospirillales bacterium CG15_BIG_FIL_POST_REV_8_21_14_020_66_15]